MTESSDDLFEQFRSMPMAQLAQYSMGFNIFVSNGESEGIMIGFMDLAPVDIARVKVIANKAYDYWNEADCIYVRAEHRKWEPC